MIKKLPKKSNERAFTLIETLVALLILAIGLLAIAQLFIAATYTNSFAYNESVAVKVAEDTLELLRGLPFSDARLSNGGTINAPVPYSLGSGTPAPEVAQCSVGSSIHADRDHVLGVYFDPQQLGGTGPIVSYIPKLADCSSTNFDRRQFEVRWQVIGYNPTVAATTSPTIIPDNAFNAYNDDFPFNQTNPPAPPNFSAPTPPDLNGDTTKLIIVRVIPVGAKGATRLAKRVQIATIMTRPS
ncbi:MAG: prepilin-type N-terminal cleavage/methylation domain-containing protein [Acidobacteriota bacterium]